MTRILIRQGEGPINAYDRVQREASAARRTLNRIIEDNPDLNSTTASRATAPGDSRKLRGIPAIGRGVAGAIPGSRPGETLR